MMVVPRKLTVNGQTHNVAVEPNDTLLDTLRDKLRLIGTKKGCNVGDCGACTVLVNGVPMNSCLLLTAEMEDRVAEACRIVRDVTGHPEGRKAH